MQGILYQEKMQITSLDTLIYQYLMIIYYIMYFLLRNKFFITTNFHQNPSSGSGENNENVKSYTLLRTRPDGIAIVHGFSSGFSLDVQYFSWLKQRRHEIYVKKVSFFYVHQQRVSMTLFFIIYTKRRQDILQSFPPNIVAWYCVLSKSSCHSSDRGFIVNVFVSEETIYLNTF